MTPTTKIALSPKPGEPPRSEVLWDGRPTGCLIHGRALEGAFEVGGFALVLATEGTPYEEALFVSLLGPKGAALVEERTLAIPYQPGVVRDVRVVSERALELSFFGSERSRITVHERARALRELIPPRGWSHPGISARYMEVERSG